MIRYAVVDLGHIAQSAILPAFAQARQNSALAALVSDDPKKLTQLSRRYGVRRVCSYEDADDLFHSGQIDAVYITLPNSMHRDYTERAARAGLHVLCEKPTAVSSADCERMIEVTRQNGVKLMIAYRLHFERGNLEAAEMARSGTLGDLRFFTSNLSMPSGEEGIADVRVIEALNRSIETGRWISPELPQRRRRPSRRQLSGAGARAD